MKCLKFHNHGRWAIGLALAVNAYIAVADWGLYALHSRGIAQGVLSYLNGVSAVLQVPGSAVAIALGIRHRSHTTPTAWCFLVAFNLVLWTIGLWILLRLLFPSRKPAEIPAQPEQLPPGDEPERVSRRAMLTGGVRIAVAGTAAVAAYSVFYAPRRFEVSRRTLALRGLPPELDALRLVQLTDIHHGPNISLQYVRDVVAAANALQPDLVLLTGDYVYSSPRYIAPVIRELAALRGSIGVVGVLGNHDWWESAKLTRQEFARRGMPLIDNSRLFLTPDRKLVPASDRGLCLAGIGDYWEDEVRFDLALADVPESMPRLLLSHNPDAAETPELRQMRPRIDLMICGHTHGGQVRFPLVGAMIVPSRYGQKYAQGLVHGPACDVFVSRGLGTTILPVRFCVPPEIALIELRATT